MELLCSSPLKVAPRTKRLFRHKAESRLQAQESSLQQSHVKEPLPDFDRLPELLVLHPIAAERESEGAVACRNQSAGHGCHNEVFPYTMNPYTVYGQGVFFFVVAPFCSCPASLVSRKFFAVGPGCAKCFFFCCAPLGAATFRRGQSKKKTPPRVFVFLLRPRRKAREGEAPLGAGTGPEQKKNTPPSRVFFFLLRPRAGAQRGFSFPCLSPGPQQKKHPGWCFFFCSGPVPARGFSFPCLSPGPEQKKKKKFFFFFCCGPARTLTHSLRAWVAMPSPSPGWCFFFCCGPTRTGVVFFLFFFFAVAPPGRSLTHCGLGRFRQGPGGVFFLLRPRRVFLDNNKKCLGYYIGSKKTRRGHSKKKTPLPTVYVWGEKHGGPFEVNPCSTPRVQCAVSTFIAFS